MKFTTWFIFLILFSAHICSCKKDRKNGWEITYSGFRTEFDTLVAVHTDPFSSTKPFLPSLGGASHIYNEIHEREGVISHEINDIKEIVFSLPPTIDSEFAFQNEELMEHLHCAVYQLYNGARSKYNGYYLVTEGIITGKQINGEWEIEIAVSYLSEDDHRYHFRSELNY